MNDIFKFFFFICKLFLLVMGFVENMVGYVCFCCGEISDIFGKGGGEVMVYKEGVGFLGRVFIDIVFVLLLDVVSKGEVLGEGVVEYMFDEVVEG